MSRLTTTRDGRAITTSGLTRLTGGRVRVIASISGFVARVRRTRSRGGRDGASGGEGDLAVGALDHSAVVHRVDE